MIYTVGKLIWLKKFYKWSWGMFMHANKEMHAGNADGSYPKAGVWKLLYPPQALFWGEGGGYWFHPVRLSVCLSRVCGRDLVHAFSKRWEHRFFWISVHSLLTIWQCTPIVFSYWFDNISPFYRLLTVFDNKKNKKWCLENYEELKILLKSCYNV